MQGIRHTYGGQALMEPHKVLPVVSSDIDVLVVLVAKDHMKKHCKENREFLAEIGPEASRNFC